MLSHRSELRIRATGLLVVTGVLLGSVLVGAQECARGLQDDAGAPAAAGLLEVKAAPLRVSYDMVLGRITPGTEPGRRSGLYTIWDCGKCTQWAVLARNREVLDWGVRTPGAMVNGIELGYLTGSTSCPNVPDPDEPNCVSLYLVVYENENGFNDPDSIPIVVFDFNSLPGGDPNYPETNVWGGERRFVRRG
jgi:hypothetical protein